VSVPFELGVAFVLSFVGVCCRMVGAAFVFVLAFALFARCSPNLCSFPLCCRPAYHGRYIAGHGHKKMKGTIERLLKKT